MSERKITVAAVQLNSGEDKEKNLKIACGLIDRATALGARVVILPEMFNCYTTMAAMVRCAENVNGPTINALTKKAKENKINIICGSIFEKAEKDGRAYNASVALNSEGEILEIYRKIHLFDVDISGQVTFKESQGVASGNKIVTVEIEGFTAGITICYDLRFPELFRTLTLRGAQIIFMPSAFTAATGRFHWEALLKARAIENQVYIVAANQFGTHPNGLKSYGRSMIIDPYGRVIAEAGTDGETVITSTLDMDLMENTRKEMPLLQHRRGDLYGN
ncbi:MAG: carbon-nitrogen hydrolase family protein [Candidatus Brocadiales bacterium]